MGDRWVGVRIVYELLFLLQKKREREKKVEREEPSTEVNQCTSLFALEESGAACCSWSVIAVVLSYAWLSSVSVVYARSFHSAAAQHCTALHFSPPPI